MPVPVRLLPRRVGAERFITNNASGCTTRIPEITVTYPDDLPEP